MLTWFLSQLGLALYTKINLWKLRTSTYYIMLWYLNTEVISLVKLHDMNSKYSKNQWIWSLAKIDQFLIQTQINSIDFCPNCSQWDITNYNLASAYRKLNKEMGQHDQGQSLFHPSCFSSPFIYKAKILSTHYVTETKDMPGDETSSRMQGVVVVGVVMMIMLKELKCNLMMMMMILLIITIQQSRFYYYSHFTDEKNWD